MIKVCAYLNKELLCLSSFEKEEDADDFMKNDYVLCFADEVEENEDVVISSDDMFTVVDDETIPFSEIFSDVTEEPEEEIELPF